MAGTSTNTAILLTFLLCWQLSCGARISIDPVKFEGLVITAVNISCEPDTVKNGVEAVIVIEITREDQQRIASVRQGSQITYGRELTTGIQAEGVLDSSVNKCFLRVTMPQVLTKDSGKYTCNVYFMDEMGFIDKETVWNNLVVDDMDVHSHLAFVIQKLFIQQEIIKELGHELKKEKSVCVDRLGQLENVNRNQSRYIQKWINNEKTTMKRLVRLEDNDRNQSRQIQDLITNGTYVSAFSASVNISGYKAKRAHTLIFGDVITKKGEGYDEKTGLFKAPYRGLYAFHLYLYNYHIGKLIRVILQVKEKDLALLRARDKYLDDESSLSCVVFLEPGDIVQVVVDTTSGMKLSYFKHDNIFSGYLVKAL